MQKLEISIWYDRKDKSNTDLTDENNFSGYATRSYEVSDEVAETITDNLKANGFEEAKGWDTDSVLYNAERDILIDISWNDLEEPYAHGADEVLKGILTADKSLLIN